MRHIHASVAYIAHHDLLLARLLVRLLKFLLLLPRGVCESENLERETLYKGMRARGNSFHYTTVIGYYRPTIGHSVVLPIAAKH
jgi:hypothetical protein